MSERYKRITAVGLFIGGLVLIGYNFLRSSEPKVHGQQVEQAVYLDSLFTVKASEPIQEQEADILALFILKSDVCPPCVNNTLEYIDLINEREDLRIATSALFMEAEPDKVRRFVNITGLSVPYRVAIKDKIPVPLKNSIQELVFIDVNEEEIFYRLTIPGNITSKREYKKKILVQALERGDN